MSVGNAQDIWKPDTLAQGFATRKLGTNLLAQPTIPNNRPPQYGLRRRADRTQVPSRGRLVWMQYLKCVLY
jgi:hypothetical protein